MRNVVLASTDAEFPVALLASINGREVGPREWSSQAIQSHINSEHPWVVLTDEGRYTAFILYVQFDDVIEVCYLETLSHFRGQGQMKRLLGHLLGLHPGVRFWLDVHESNQPARLLYEEMGFKTSGLRKGYYRDGGDCFLLERREMPVSG